MVCSFTQHFLTIFVWSRNTRITRHCPQGVSNRAREDAHTVYQSKKTWLKAIQGNNSESKTHCRQVMSKRRKGPEEMAQKGKQSD